MHTPPSVRRAVVRTAGLRRIRGHRAAAVTVILASAGLLLSSGGMAGASPQATIPQVQAKLQALNLKANVLDQQYDQALQELAAADQRLALVNKEVARYRAQFDGMRTEIARIAATSYEDGGVSSPEALLTSGNAQQVLNQSSILLELSSADSAEISQFVAAAKQLTSTQQTAQRTRAGILALKNSLGKRKAELNGLISQQQSLLAQLTPAQQAATGPGGGGSSGSGPSSPPVQYSGPTSTQAEKAVAFAYAQLGCPYVYGGTGPCSNGFDCSGLTMEAWASAGVAIPRTSEEQWSGLPAVSTSALEPGDILVFLGGAHVGIYVGGGYLIDAPHTGADVEKVQLSGWYTANLDAAVRP